MDSGDPRSNGEEYPDLTAYDACKNIDDSKRVTKLVHSIHSICEASGFSIDGRISLIDNKTGKIWR